MENADSTLCADPLVCDVPLETSDLNQDPDAEEGELEASLYAALHHAWASPEEEVVANEPSSDGNSLFHHALRRQRQKLGKKGRKDDEFIAQLDSMLIDMAPRQIAEKLCEVHQGNVKPRIISKLFAGSQIPAKQLRLMRRGVRKHLRRIQSKKGKKKSEVAPSRTQTKAEVPAKRIRKATEPQVEELPNPTMPPLATNASLDLPIKLESDEQESRRVISARKRITAIYQEFQRELDQRRGLNKRATWLPYSHQISKLQHIIDIERKRDGTRRCMQCGDARHTSCTKLCRVCGVEGHTAADSCIFHLRNLRCTRCHRQGHDTTKCAELWRQYHSTTAQDAPLVVDRSVNVRRSCSHCGRAGHFYAECRMLHQDEHRSSFLVTNYGDATSSKQQLSRRNTATDRNAQATVYQQEPEQINRNQRQLRSLTTKVRFVNERQQPTKDRNAGITRGRMRPRKG